MAPVELEVAAASQLCSNGVGRDAEYLAARIRTHRLAFSPSSYTNSRGDMCNVLALGS